VSRSAIDLGAGKTRAGSEWIRQKIKDGFDRVCLIAPTFGDVRDVMVEGPSGILAMSSEHDCDIRGNLVGRPLWEPSKRRLTWNNGATGAVFTAEVAPRPKQGFWAS
jgi:phage terminase large subunit-like protein